METPTVPSTPVQQGTGTSDRTRVIAVGGIVLLIVILVAGYYFLHGKNGGFAGSTPAFAVSVGPAPASPLYVIDKTSGTLKPLTVTVKGVALPALDAVKAADGSWYYILAEHSSTPVGNLYVQKPDGTIMALTTSKTAKYNLSYDAQSGRLAYQAIVYKNDLDFFTNQQWDLMIYDPSLQKETVVGKGANPHLLTGGQALIYRDGGKLNVEVLGTHATSTITNLPKGNPVYAIDSKATALSLYNPVSHAIDLFAITKSTSLNYLSSSKVSIPPISVGYVGDALVAAYASKTASSTYYAFSRPDLSGLNAITIPGIAGQIPQRLYIYE